MALMPAAVQAPLLPCRAAQRLEARRTPSVARAALFRRAPPPPPPFWQQPYTWAALAVVVGLALGVRYLYRRSKKEKDVKMSMAEMYFRLEKSALAGPVAAELESTSGVAPPAPSKPLPTPAPTTMPAPTTTPPPTPTKAPAPKPAAEAAPKASPAPPTPPAVPPPASPPTPATKPAPTAAAEPKASPPAAAQAAPPPSPKSPPAPTVPPTKPPATKASPPAAKAPPPTPTKPPAPEKAVPAETKPPATTAPPPKAAPTPPSSSKEDISAEEKEKKGFGWLLNRNKSVEAPKLGELLSEEPDRPVKFLRAVASELCLDAPGIFDGTNGLTVVPDSVPAKSILLHAAVKAEAEKLEPKEVAQGTVDVAKSMVREMVEKAAGIKDSKGKREVLDKVVLLANNSQSITSTITPDVEAGLPVYEGSLRYKTLEGLYDVYLENSVDDMRETSAAMMGAFMGGEDQSKSQKTVEEMTVRAEQQEKAQNTLASIFKISEGKAQKLLDKKMKAVTEQVQKDLMSGLMSGTS